MADTQPRGFCTPEQAAEWIRGLMEKAFYSSDKQDLAPRLCREGQTQKRLVWLLNNTLPFPLLENPSQEVVLHEPRQDLRKRPGYVNSWFCVTDGNSPPERTFAESPGEGGVRGRREAALEAAALGAVPARELPVGWQRRWGKGSAQK